MGLTEHTGHGISTIVKTYGVEVFEMEANYILYTIPFDDVVLDKIKSENVGNNVGNLSLNKMKRRSFLNRKN